jgi:hypothetical protein
MKTLFLIIMSLAVVKGEKILYDFSAIPTSGKWYVVNDDVMGGVSDSYIQFNSDSTATFSGNLSGENYGGFASIRSQLENSTSDNFKGVIIKVRGDGNFYNLRFRTNQNFDGYAYQAIFQTEKDVWKEFKIPFRDFKATFRGRTLNDKPALDSENIKQIGFLIADKQFGEFTMDIDWIKFYY